MSKWAVYGTVVGSKFLGVIEADTAEEAVAKAIRNASVSLCHQCDEECEGAEITDAIAEPEA